MREILKQMVRFSFFDLYEKQRDFRSAQKRRNRRKEIIKEYLNHEEKKLHIGCGSNILSGWLNTDLNDMHQDVAHLNAGEIFPFEDNTFDFVFSEHLFEHLTPSEQVNFLRESKRVLKENGVLRIATPDLEFLINLYQEKKSTENQEYLDWALGQSKALKKLPVEAHGGVTSYAYVINNFFKAWGHEMIHNYDSLSKLAINCGFSLAREQKVGHSEFSQLCNIERHGEIIPARFNEKETMVIEFSK